MISTSPHKEKEARERLGADNFIVSKNQEQMAVRTFCMKLAASTTLLPLVELLTEAAFEGLDHVITRAANSRTQYNSMITAKATPRSPTHLQDSGEHVTLLTTVPCLHLRIC